MASSQPFIETLRYYLNPADGRYEDLKRGNIRVNIFKDLTAGLIVAMVAIPLAMGFDPGNGMIKDLRVTSDRHALEAGTVTD